MTDPTPVQLRYLSYMLAYLEGFGQPPSMAEIARSLDEPVGGGRKRRVWAGPAARLGGKP